MDDISVFKGILPTPIATTTWQQALANIKSDKYKKVIQQGQKITDKVKYRQFKTKLPAITFGGTFKNPRSCNNLESPTGFLIPDLDHLRNIDLVFDLLCQDENIWFVFRSPSGEGIKAGIRAKGILSDTEHKQFYYAIEQYFKDLYNLKIDPACKDIARLTFISYDPDLWINPEPQWFEIDKWTVPLPESNYVDISKIESSEGKEKYALKVLESCCERIRNSQPNDQHYTRLKTSRLIGGYSHYISDEVIMAALEQAVIDSGVKMLKPAMKTIRDGFEYGKASPIVIEDKRNDIEYYFDENSEFGDNKPDDIDDIDDKGDTRRHLTTKRENLTTQNENLTTLDDIDENLTTLDDSGGETNKQKNEKINLAIAIEEWLAISSGSWNKF